MFQEIYDALSRIDLKCWISIYLIGFAVKCLDDIIDDEIDFNVTKKIIPYIILISVIAVFINSEMAFSLFLASYCIGMFTEPYIKLPTGIYSYQETILIILLLGYLGGIKIGLWALSIIMVLHLADDLIDYKRDKKLSRKNLVITYGKVEIITVLLIFLIIALMIDYQKVFIVLILAPLVEKNYVYVLRRIND